jgi:hypothetical protein
VVVDKKSQRIICTAFSNGKRHDFRVFKESKTRIHPAITAVTDTGYQGIQKIHPKSQLPKKKTKKVPLTKQEKKKSSRRSLTTPSSHTTVRAMSHTAVSVNLLTKLCI